MRDDGFGSTGNTLIVCGGFFLAIFGANYQGYNLRELHLAVLAGIAGAFICFCAAGRYEGGAHGSRGLTYLGAALLNPARPSA